jgi:hypothetical protein
MADKKKTLISIAVALVVILVIMGAALVGSMAYMIRRHISTEFVAADVGSGQFDRERARFAGQQPLIDVHEHDAVIHRRTPSSSIQLQTLRMVAFDPESGKLVRMSIPFWLLRLAPSKKFSLSNGEIEFDEERMHLSLDDVEQAGPGLLIDGASPRGARFIVWTE